MAETGIKMIYDFFRIGGGKVADDPRNSLSAFSKEWAALDADSKVQLRAGIAIGTLTY